MNVEQMNQHSYPHWVPLHSTHRPPPPPLCPVTSRILFCHSSVNSGELVFTWLALSVHSGHFQLGRESMAREGATKANVPPWRMGSLEEGRTQSPHSSSALVCHCPTGAF